MSKTKKTRQQKIIADLRRRVGLQPLQQPPPTLTQATKKLHTGATFSYIEETYTSSFLLSDLRKTLLVTATIVGVETLLFFLHVKQVITIPMVSY
ncbi:MAG: hypothetical protein HY429_03385 [Candidatus Levybacteria bacterium]|nr:hypothetical protein [Candidatus Levybacteria bacterium]